MSNWTPAQLQAYNARDAARAHILAAHVARQHGKALAPDAAEDESPLQSDIVAECNRRGWICLHGAFGKRTRRVKGEPDLTCILPGKVILFVELKTKTGKLTPEQEGMKRWMARFGVTMHVMRSLSEFVALAESEMRSGDLIP